MPQLCEQLNGATASKVTVERGADGFVYRGADSLTPDKNEERPQALLSSKKVRR
jgi:hypothetical protein